ncbi:MAG: DUF4082 domain-containing protein, partial [Acidimicrobiales bacterium]
GSTSYSVDVVFLDDGGPAVVTTTPAAGAVGVSVDTALTVTFSEAVAAGTMVAELRDGGGGLVPVTVTQDSPTAFTITPDASLNGTSSYTATIVDARDGVGNGLSAPFSWSFTTADTSVATLFGAAVPATPAANDPSAIELGMRFEVTQAVDLTAIRFYRGPGNNGPHLGHLWTADGTQLAEVTFAPGGPDGWQSAALAAPLALTPGEVYVVSYFTPSGNYAVDGGYFNGGDIVSGPLVAAGNSGPIRNGLYAYGGGFPTGSYNGGNYWVDVEVAIP